MLCTNLRLVPNEVSTCTYSRSLTGTCMPNQDLQLFKHYIWLCTIVRFDWAQSIQKILWCPCNNILRWSSWHLCTSLTLTLRQATQISLRLVKTYTQTLSTKFVINFFFLILNTNPSPVVIVCVCVCVCVCMWKWSVTSVSLCKHSVLLVLPERAP